jgi:hypothetical protein
MARHKDLTPKVQREISIDARLMTEVELFLPRDFKGDLKYGGFNSLVSTLLTQWLQNLAQQKGQQA